MNLREAAQQALDALEFVDTQDWNEIEALRESLREHMAEIHRLRAALAEGVINEMETVEPVAYVSGFSKGYAVVEPIDRALLLPVGMALYRAPPKSKPLTNAEVGAVASDIWGSFLIAPQSYQKFARAIERAHGIGDKNE